MHRAKYFLCIIWLLAGCAVWAQDEPLLTGTIAGIKRESIMLQVRPPFSLHVGSGVENYTIPVDKDGNFSFRSRYKKADVILYDSTDEGPRILLYLNNASLCVQWRAGAMLPSFNVIQDPGDLNRASVALQQLVSHEYDSLLNKKDEEPDFGKTVQAVNSLNEKGFYFLKKQRRKLNSAGYLQLAYDFYYRNLELIVTARNYSPLFTNNITGRFPFIVCYDYKYDQYFNIRKNEAESTTTTMVQTAAYMDSLKKQFAETAARSLWLMNFVVADNDILSMSHAYRSFLNTSVYSLLMPFTGYPYPNLDKRSLSDFDNYYLWIHGIIQQQKVTDWLLANRWQTFASQDRGYADSAGYSKLYNSLSDNEIKQWLTERLATISAISPGIKAPAFTLFNEKNRPVSLAQFLGKPVYITFWSTSCAPCIEELKLCNKPVTGKFKDDVVFINIALDENKKIWKEALNKYDIRGINCIAEHGWADDVASGYKIAGIPCNVLINKEGIIQSYNSIKLCDLPESNEFLKMTGK